MEVHQIYFGILTQFTLFYKIPLFISFPLISTEIPLPKFWFPFYRSHTPYTMIVMIARCGRSWCRKWSVWIACSATKSAAKLVDAFGVSWGYVQVFQHSPCYYYIGLYWLFTFWIYLICVFLNLNICCNVLILFRCFFSYRRWWSFARHFIGGSVGVQHSLCGLYNLCMAFYRWQSGCAAVSLRSVQPLHGIL